VLETPEINIEIIMHEPYGNLPPKNSADTIKM
jgi:hypothetical protein